MSISLELLAWARVMSYLFLAVMLAFTSTYSARMRWALLLTAGSFVINSVGAFAVACNQIGARDMVLNLQTVFVMIVALQWIRTIRVIARK